MSFNEINLIYNVSLSLFLGALIGLERERLINNDQPDRSNATAGFRTFMVITMLGTVLTYLNKLLPGSFLIGMAFAGLMLTVSYFFSNKLYKKVGITSEISAIIMFLVGALVATEKQRAALIITVALLTVLYLRDTLHAFAHKISDQELYDTIKFAIIAFVVLPLLPNKTIDPWDIINPTRVWILVILISGLSFTGYILHRIFSREKTLTLTGLLGGIISSTGLTLTMANWSKKRIEKSHILAWTIIIAELVSTGRVIIELATLNQALLLKFIKIALIILAIGISALTVMYFHDKPTKHKGREIEIKSPFTLKPALEFALIFVFISWFAYFAQEHWGSWGIYAASFLSGLAKIDAITVSMATLAGKSVDLELAARAIAFGLSVSALAKIAICRIFGSRELAYKIAPYMLSIAIGGIVGVLLV